MFSLPKCNCCIGRQHCAWQALSSASNTSHRNTCSSGSMLGNTESYQTSGGPRSGLGCGTTSPEAWVVTQQILWHMKLSAVWENMQCMMEFMAIPVKESQHKTIWLQSKAMQSAVEKYNFWEIACYWALVDPECLTMSTKYCVPYKLSQNHQDIKFMNSTAVYQKTKTVHLRLGSSRTRGTRQLYAQVAQTSMSPSTVASQLFLPLVPTAT